MAYPTDSGTTYTTKLDNTDVIQAADVNNLQTEVTALKTKVGTDNSATNTTIDYLVKNSASNGGGHVQTVAKGGTGKTSLVAYALVAGGTTSTAEVQQVSGVGNDNQVLTSNGADTLPTWQTPQTSFLYSSTALTRVLNTTTETDLFSTTVTGGMLGTNKGIRGRLYVSTLYRSASSHTLTLRLKLGSTTIASNALAITQNDTNKTVGYIDFLIVAAGSATAQVGQFEMNTTEASYSGTTLSQSNHMKGSGTSTENSASDLTLKMTAQWGSFNGDTEIAVNCVLIEKVV